MGLTQLHLISLLMMGSSLLAIFLSFHAWKRRYNEAFLPMSFLMVSVAVWSFSYGLELISVSLTQMKILTVIYYTGITTIPVFWLIFAARYSDNDNWLTPLNIKLLFIIPVFSLAMLATNNVHHLFDICRTFVLSRFRIRSITVRPHLVAAFCLFVLCFDIGVFDVNEHVL